MMRGFSMAMAGVALALATPAARAEEALPLVGDVVAKARAVMDRKPTEVVCKVSVDTMLMDKSGKPEHEEHREGKATLRGDDQDIESQKVVRDGKPLTVDEITEERQKVLKQKKKRKEGEEFDISPLASKNAPSEAFELVRKETLWGRPAYVLKVKALKSSPQLANGTVWIDAETFVELKGELVPSEMPPHADWVKVQEQYVLGPKAVPVPAFLHIEGAGHMMFMHKQFKTTLRWDDCR
jgi:hypothetical protein